MWRDLHQHEASIPESQILENKMCEHKDFDAYVAVNRIEDIGKFAADVTITCRECRRPFVFLGLPGGVRIGSPTVSLDGTEARLAIAPMEDDIYERIIAHA